MRVGWDRATDKFGIEQFAGVVGHCSSWARAGCFGGLLLGAIILIPARTAAAEAATNRAGAGSVLSNPPTATNGAQAKVIAGVAKVYDRSILHRINIEIPAALVSQIPRRTDTRVSCTFTFDGVVLTNVGVRQAGGTAHPYKPINDKPTLSIKFDEFVKGQDLFDLDKIVLKNELQDLSLVNEHMTYEIFRRAGIAAPMTAHAIVTINGYLNGIYLMREPINKQFLLRNFGKGFEQGNLYEEDLTTGDIIQNPARADLKNEQVDSRNRADLFAMANALGSATPANFVATMAPRFDLDRYLTYYAVEAVTSYFDGFSMHHNNSYLYDHPKDGRFIVIPQGADESFWATGTPITRIQSPLQPPGSAIARQLRAVPALEARFEAEVRRIGSAPVWDQQVLSDRLAQVSKIFATAPKVGRTAADLSSFQRYLPIVETFIRAGGTSKGTVGLPR